MKRIVPPTHDVLTKDALSLGRLIAAGEVSSEEVTRAHLERIEAVEPDVNAFVTVTADEAIAAAKAVDARRAAGEELQSPLAGVPVGVKDVLSTRGTRTTCGSKLLENWVPPFDATVVARLREAGAVIVGKTNMDEFAMGSSTEWSAYGTSNNPWDTGRTPGGSGGGSSASVAAYEVPIALGSDTGGSIRQPAAVTGTVGVKPTYGGVSRYGSIALASSLDQVGPCARTVADCAALQTIIGGHDPMDSTSLPQQWDGLLDAALNGSLEGKKVGVVTELGGDGYDAGVRESFSQALEVIRENGAEIVEVSCPHFEYALSAYYILLPSEASSNLARFDAMRYGMRVAPEGKTLDEASAEEVMAATRAAGFGKEVKRRIILGTYALSSGYYDAYYGKAQQVRTLVQRDFAKAFESVDVLVSPTAPTTAFKFGEKLSDPVAMYLNDIATIPANLAGVPGMSLPSGISSDDGLPVGIQVLAPARGDALMYEVGGALERAFEKAWGGPFQAQNMSGTTVEEA